MTRRILVPLDGTPATESALSEAVRVASPQSEIHLLHIVPIPTPPVGMDPALFVDIPEHARPYLQILRERLPLFGGLDLVRPGDPAEEILKAALELNIDWISMCTHARAGVARWLLGSVAARVVRESRLPVLLTRPGRHPRTSVFRRILVALDGSDYSARVLKDVQPLASRTGAEIVLLHVEPPVHDPAPQWAPEAPYSVRATPEYRYQALAHELERSGLQATAVVSVGHPAGEILRQARETEADLIAMCTHGRTGWERTFEGSVAEEVLRGADRPVLLIRPDGISNPGRQP